MEPQHDNPAGNPGGGDFLNRPHEPLLHPILHPLTLAQFYGKHHEAAAAADAREVLDLATRFCREAQVFGLDTQTDAGFDWVLTPSRFSNRISLELGNRAGGTKVHVEPGITPSQLDVTIHAGVLGHTRLAPAYLNLPSDERAGLLAQLQQSIAEVQANRAAADQLQLLRAQPELPQEAPALPQLDIAGLLQRYEVPEEQAKATEQHLIQTLGGTLSTMHGSEVIAAAHQHCEHPGLYGAPFQTWLCENSTLGNLAAVNACLAMGADPNCPNARGLMPIHLAARQGEGAIVRRLLEHGADPALTAPNGQTTLSMAEGHRVAQTYVALGMQRSVQNYPAGLMERYGATPEQAEALELKLIDAHGPQLARFHVAELLASAHAFHPELTFNVPSQTWLEEGISLNAPEVVDAALHLGADPNQPDAMGDRPLHQAVRSESHVIVRRLLEVQADPSQVNHFGQAPLHLAAQWKQARVCLELMAAGADPGQLDREGRKPGDAHREKAREQVHDL